MCRRAPGPSPQGVLRLYLDSSSAGWEAHPCSKQPFLPWRPLAFRCCREKAGGLVSILSYSSACEPLKTSVSSLVNVCVGAHPHFQDEGRMGVNCMVNQSAQGPGKESIPELPRRCTGALLCPWCRQGGRMLPASGAWDKSLLAVTTHRLCA